jgi:hypothetical protein
MLRDRLRAIQGAAQSLLNGRVPAFRPPLTLAKVSWHCPREPGRQHLVGGTALVGSAPGERLELSTSRLTAARSAN